MPCFNSHHSNIIHNVYNPRPWLSADWLWPPMNYYLSLFFCDLYVPLPLAVPHLCRLYCISMSQVSLEGKPHSPTSLKHSPYTHLSAKSSTSAWELSSFLLCTSDGSAAAVTAVLVVMWKQQRWRQCRTSYYLLLVPLVERTASCTCFGSGEWRVHQVGGVGRTMHSHWHCIPTMLTPYPNST